MEQFNKENRNSRKTEHISLSGWQQEDNKTALPSPYSFLLHFFELDNKHWIRNKSKLTIWWWDEQACLEDNSLLCFLSRGSLCECNSYLHHNIEAGGTQVNGKCKQQWETCAGSGKFSNSPQFSFPWHARCYVDQDSSCLDVKPSITGSPYRWAYLQSDQSQKQIDRHRI